MSRVKGSRFPLVLAAVTLVGAMVLPYAAPLACVLSDPTMASMEGMPDMDSPAAAWTAQGHAVGCSGDISRCSLTNVGPVQSVAHNSAQQPQWLTEPALLKLAVPAEQQPPPTPPPLA